MFFIADSEERRILDPTTSEGEEGADGHKEVGDHDENIAGVYLKEMVKIPLLTRAREIELGERIQLGEQRLTTLILKCLDLLKKIDRANQNPYRDWVEQEQEDETHSKEEMIRKIVLEQEKLREHSGSDENELGDCLSELRKTEADVKAAKAEMIQSNLRLVVRIARIYVNRGLSLLDLVQEGNLGLMKAVTKYDYRKGYKFSTYASWWIRQAITRALANKSKTVRIPVHLLETRRRVDRAKSQLIKNLGRDPLAEEIAEQARISLTDVLKALNLMQKPVSLETPVGDDGGKLEGLIESEASMSYNDNLLRNMDLAKRTRDLLSLLKPREEQILRLRFGIGEPTSYTLQEIGRRFGISRERVRQIEGRAIRRLKTQCT